MVVEGTVQAKMQIAMGGERMEAGVLPHMMGTYDRRCSCFVSDFMNPFDQLDVGSRVFAFG